MNVQFDSIYKYVVDEKEIILSKLIKTCIAKDGVPDGEYFATYTVIIGPVQYHGSSCIMAVLEPNSQANEIEAFALAKFNGETWELFDGPMYESIIFKADDREHRIWFCTLKCSAKGIEFERFWRDVDH